MSAAVEEAPESVPPKEEPERFVLRGCPRPVVRFRRGLLAGVAGAVAAGMIALAWVALEPSSFRLASGKASNEAANVAPAEALANVPASYDKVPMLGPPLPGDLGPPILKQQRRELAAGKRDAGSPSNSKQVEDIEAERRAAAAQAALGSSVLVKLERAGGGTDVRSAHDAVTPARPSGGADNSASAHPVAADEPVNAFNARSAAASPSTLSAGTIIPASLITGINSDLPGMVIAQVTEPVRDSATGRTILVPQGARLIGSYESKVAFGQKRVLLVWDRIVFPDGSSIALGKAPAADVSGNSGLEDRVDFHGGSIAKGVALATILGVGSGVNTRDESDLAGALRSSLQQSGTNAGQQIVSRQLDVQPTLTIRPGWPVLAVLRENLVLEPWKG